MEKTRQAFIGIVHSMNCGYEAIDVLSARPLTAEEAIGNPGRTDYPIQTGKEVMIEAVFRGCKGQAFTDQPGEFHGNVQSVIDLPLKDNFERAVYIATVNAVLRSYGVIDKTVHCKDKEPAQCALQLAEYVSKRFGNPRIAFVGLQPGMVSALSEAFEMRVVDLDTQNIGKRFGDVVVESADKTEEILQWGEIVLATGSTSVNDSMRRLFSEKPTIFYGVTVSGIASINGLEQFCPYGH